jgi:hypothetical protein
MPGSYLVLELTNRCSLACIHCAVSEEGHPHHSRTGFLDLSVVQALLDDLVEVGGRFDELILFWLGEPLLHPHFSTIYRRALRTAVLHGTFGGVQVHTNGTHLESRVARAGLNDAAVRQTWHFSLDAVGTDTYRRIKGADRYGRVVTNVRGFLDAKADTGARWPRPVFQFIVGSNNVDEVRPFAELWTRECSDRSIRSRLAAAQVPSGDDAVVFFRQLDCPTPEMQVRENDVFRRAMDELGIEVPEGRVNRGPLRASNQTVCSGFWKSPVVSWRGELTTCTRDSRLENMLGTLREQRFSAMWWGPAMAETRRKVAGGSYEGLPPCATCFIPRSANYVDLDSEDVAKQRAWEEGDPAWVA